MQHKRAASGRALVEHRTDGLLAEQSARALNATSCCSGSAKGEPQGGGARMLRPHSMHSVLLSSLVLASDARSRQAGADRFAGRRRWIGTIALEAGDRAAVESHTASLPTANDVEQRTHASARRSLSTRRAIRTKL